MFDAQDTVHLLLDDPLSNVDLCPASEMKRLTGRLADDLDKTVVAKLNDINFAAGWDHQIVALRSVRVMLDVPFPPGPKGCRPRLCARSARTSVVAIERKGHRPDMHWR